MPGGGGGIRTPVRITAEAVFKTAAFSRSATPPYFYLQIFQGKYISEMLEK
jgi:hypothetical protein